MGKKDIVESPKTNMCKRSKSDLFDKKTNMCKKSNSDLFDKKTNMCKKSKSDFFDKRTNICKKSKSDLFDKGQSFRNVVAISINQSSKNPLYRRVSDVQIRALKRYSAELLNDVDWYETMKDLCKKERCKGTYVEKYSPVHMYKDNRTLLNFDYK